jgi:hypothetical protein
MMSVEDRIVAIGLALFIIALLASAYHDFTHPTDEQIIAAVFFGMILLGMAVIVGVLSGAAVLLLIVAIFGKPRWFEKWCRRGMER